MKTNTIIDIITAMATGNDRNIKVSIEYDMNAPEGEEFKTIFVSNDKNKGGCGRARGLFESHMGDSIEMTAEQARQQDIENNAFMPDPEPDPEVTPEVAPEMAPDPE